MKLVVAVITGMLFVGVAGSANAAPADCEAERCLIQAEIDAACPCAEAKNHGRYTTCVARVVNAAAKAGTISKSCRGKINGCFIRSTCGKKAGAVACDLQGSGVGGRCRPLSSESQCLKRGGTVVASCCETCGPGTTATPTPGAPTTTPTPEPTEIPTGVPTDQPTDIATPTATASDSSTPEPTEQPTDQPTGVPTDQPTGVPTDQPTGVPTDQPTGVPTDQPTGVPTDQPTGVPTDQPTGVPTDQPTGVPTDQPTGVPTDQPTGVPTDQPTDVPSPSVTPSAGPTDQPTEQPTGVPTEQPTDQPTEQPTEQPTDQPTPTVTVTPSPEPTSVTPGLCDEPGQPVCPNAGNGLEICSITGTCNCPTKVSFTGDPSQPNTILDTGWTGIAHRAPVISNGDVTVNLSGCTGEGTTDRPQCPRNCFVSGPIENTLSDQIRNHRCSNDSSIICTDNTPCTTSHCIGGPNEDAACTVDSQCPSSQCSGSGTCRFFFGAPLPLVAGGVGTCVENIFNGGITGTANLETGEAASVANLTSRVHSAVISTDTPCPVCVGDGTINDGVQGGTCTGGNRSGKACDGNGTVFNRDDFGTTSLDCTTPIATIAVLPIDLTNSTGSVAKAITASSPNCTGLAGAKCACDTCNNANAEPCDDNNDCPVSGGNPGICGGRRCLGGSNIGAPCTVASQCPGGSCARPGQPTQPNGCSDDSTTPEVNGSICIDTAPVGDNEGECIEGPPTGVCSDSSGHPQRSCQVDNECCDDAPGCASDPETPGECLIGNRLCFLDNGLGGSIIGTGVADPPMNDVANPTLAAVFCIGPTSAPAVNIAAGLPGPGRVTISGTALGLP